MPLKITARHMSISDETRLYLDKKVNRLRRLVPKIDEMSFTLSKEKLLVDAEAGFRAGKIAIQAHIRAGHVNEAIDMLVDKLEAQITKARKKLCDKSQAAREAARVDGQALAPEEESAEAEEAEQDDDLDDWRVAQG